MSKIKTILKAINLWLAKRLYPAGKKLWPIIKKIAPAGILALILALSLWLRIVPSWDNVFQNEVKYAADDGVYHMRLIENMLLGDHFPHRLFFDPFTYFPYGAYIHFAPFYEYPLAWAIWLISFGHPTLAIINKIAPFYPPVLGTLAVLVVYFIGKALWGRFAGLVAAFLATLSSTLLFRSVLGATDHHQAEYLYSSLAMLFLILAVLKPQGKKFLLWSILSGLSLALYFLAWKGALMFLLLIFVFIFGYYFIEYLSGRIHNWLLQAGIIIFTITLVALSFFFNHPDIIHSRLYNVGYVASLLTGILSFLILGLLGHWLNKKSWPRSLLPVCLLVVAVVGYFILKLFLPAILKELIYCLAALNSGMTPYPLIRELVGEMAPLTIGGAFDDFSCLFYLAFIPLIIFICKFIKHRRPEHLLLTIWFIMTVVVSGAIWPALGLRRYEYYLAIPLTLFGGFLITKGLSLARSGLALWKSQKQTTSGIFLLLGSCLLIFNLIYFVFYPFPLNLIEKYPANLPKIILNALATANNGIMNVETDWFDTFTWLRNNTPDPGIDYYGRYTEPPFNPNTGKFFTYPYPDTAYGIVASWDVGHMLTYYAHRIPTANNFQLGIGKIKDEKIVPGEATFFIETDQDKAYKILTQLKTRYIIADFNGSYAYSAFGAKPGWVDDSSMNYFVEQNGEIVATDNYDKSMAARLYLLDGRKWTPAKTSDNQSPQTIEALGHYRLVYESKTSSASMPEMFNEKNAQLKMIKIFEFVPGATITGSAKSGTIIEISAKISTNQQRNFTWQASTVADKHNKFELIVPYSTDGKKAWEAQGTKMEVFAAPYRLTIGKTKKTVNVSEKDIMKGKTIKIK